MCSVFLLTPWPIWIAKQRNYHLPCHDWSTRHGKHNHQGYIAANFYSFSVCGNSLHVIMLRFLMYSEQHELRITVCYCGKNNVFFPVQFKTVIKNKSCVLYCYISLLSMFSMSRYFVKQNMNADVHFGRWWDNFKDWAVSTSVDKQMEIASLLLFMDFCWFANNTWSLFIMIVVWNPICFS